MVEYLHLFINILQFFFQLLCIAQEKPLWDAYKEKKGKNLPRCIIPSKFDWIDCPPSMEKVKVLCQKIGLKRLIKYS